MEYNDPSIQEILGILVKLGTSAPAPENVLTAEVAAFQYFPRWLFEPTYLESQAEAREHAGAGPTFCCDDFWVGNLDCPLSFMVFFKPDGRLK